MDCPDCGHDRTSVVDTRTGEDGATVRRRRECRRCSFRFTTYERPEWETLQVKKRDGRIEPFDRGKLRGGIERAVEKRPVDAAAVEALVDEVERELAGRGTRIVSSSLVGELASERLRDIDPVAYIRFVSVYKAFSDPEEFLDELDGVLDDRLDDADDASGSGDASDSGDAPRSDDDLDTSPSNDASDAPDAPDATRHDSPDG